MATNNNTKSKFIFGTILALLLVGGVYYFYTNYSEYIQNNLYKDIRSKFFNDITTSEDSIKKLQTSYKQFESEKAELLQLLTNRDKYIQQLTMRNDSISILLDRSDSTILKLKNDNHEELNAVNNWNATEYQQFFSDYYKGH